MPHTSRFLMTGSTLLLLASIMMAQKAKVTEDCDNNHACEEGLYCITLRDNTSKCSKCVQNESDNYSRAVDEACKAEAEGFTPASSKAYQDSTASDGRVASSAFDDLFTQAKGCRDRRQEREDKCWDGGDSVHKDEIEKVATSIENITSHRNTMLSNKRIFYTDRNTYENRLSSYKDKCVQLSFNSIQQQIDAAKVALGGTEKFDCSPLDTVVNSTYDCFQAIKSLRDDAYRNVADRMPDEFVQMDTSSNEAYDKAKELRGQASDRNMCR